MKILSLNCWGGRLKALLLDFLSNHHDIDVFCLQEVFRIDNPAQAKEYRSDFDFRLYEDIKSILPGYTGYFSENQTNGLWELAIFVRDDIAIEATGSLPIAHIDNDHPRHLQYITIKYHADLLTIANLHGAWVVDNKSDTPGRLRQSEIVMEFLNGLEGEKILVGDFNLLPETESIHLIEKSMRNLISEYNITSTRTKHYTKTLDQFADYAFVSNEINVKDFSVLPDEISDHAPLLLEIQ